MHCVQVKYISRLLARYLNDFNIHLFGRTCQSVFEHAVRSFAWKRTSSVSSSVPFLLHFWDSVVASKKLKLDFNINTAKWIFWFKTVPGKTLHIPESMTNSWEFWYFCNSFPIFYIKLIRIYRETGLPEGYLSLP